MLTLRSIFDINYWGYGGRHVPIQRCSVWHLRRCLGAHHRIVHIDHYRGTSRGRRWRRRQGFFPRGRRHAYWPIGPFGAGRTLVLGHPLGITRTLVPGGSDRIEDAGIAERYEP